MFSSAFLNELLKSMPPEMQAKADKWQFMAQNEGPIAMLKNMRDELNAVIERLENDRDNSSKRGQQRYTGKKS